MPRCFACEKRLDLRQYHVMTVDGQEVRVGLYCYRRIKASGTDGWVPPRGGPRLVTFLYYQTPTPEARG